MDNQQPSLKRRPVTYKKYIALDDHSGPEVIRTCILCKNPKPLDKYPKVKSNRLGHSRRCRTCAVDENMIKYWENPEKFRKIGSRNSKIRNAKDREAVFSHYGRACECCGESHPILLTVDHIEPIGTKQREASGHRKIYQLLVRMGFPEGYRILCWNCNMGRFHNGGVCPHKEGSQTIAQASSSKRSEAPDIRLKQDDDMVETLPKGRADLSQTFHDNQSWPFAPGRVQ